MITSAKEFIELRSSEDKVMYDRASMDEAPVAVWLEVIKKYPAYRKWVAHNKTVPIEVLKILSCMDEATRRVVARKRKLTPDIFDYLSEDIDIDVRVAIAGNRKAPTSILKKLITDNNKDVSSAALLNLKERKT